MVLGGIILVGIGLRLVGVMDMPVEMFSDFRSHRVAAVKLMHGEIDYYMVQKGPAYAPWLALGFLVTGGTDYVNWLLWNSAFLFPLTAVFLFLASREALGERAMTIVPPAMLTVMPDYIHIARVTASENVALLCISVSVWAVLRAYRKQDFGNAVLAGFAFGLGLLIKSLFSMAAPFICAGFFTRIKSTFPYVHFDFGPKGRNFWRATAFAAVAVATIAPWSVYASLWVGKPVPVAAYGGLAFFVGNQPYGDALYGLGQRRIHELMPEYDLAAARGLDYEQHVAYGRWFLSHYPASLLRDFEHNFEAQFGYTGLIGAWVHRYTETGPTPYRTLLPEKIILMAMMGLGLLGLISAGGMRSSGAAAMVKLIWLYGMILMPFVVILGDERHRMAFMPVTLIMAAAYLSASVDARLRFWVPVASGLRTAGAALGRSGVELIEGPARYPLRSAAVLAGLVLVVLASIDWDAIRLRAADLTGGTVEVLNAGAIAEPNPVFGLPRGWSGSRPYEAEFTLEAEGGPYNVEAIYAAARALPLGLYVNGTLALSPVFEETFGGAYNYFARKRFIGTVILNDGVNQLTLRSAANGVPKDDSTIRLFDLPDAAALSAQISPEAARGSEIVSADGHVLELQVDGLDQASRFSFRSPVITLSEPLTAKEEYFLRVPFEADDSVRFKVWVLGHDDNGDRVREETFRAVLNYDVTSIRLRPSRDLPKVQLLFEIEGSGSVRVGPEVALRRGTALPGAEYVGPFIEEIRLDPVDE